MFDGLGKAAALRNNRALFVAGMIALAGVGCVEVSQMAAAQDPENRQPGHGQVVDRLAQFVKSTDSHAHSDPLACTNVQISQRAPLIAPTNAGVADFARLLHGTWVRRLTIRGVPVETNSFLYFDTSSPEAGQGQALMIDRTYQGWDNLASRSGSAYTNPARPATKASFVRQTEEKGLPGAELEVPATTGAYWSVSIKPALADAASQGHSGVTLALAGDYRGTGDEYPPNGFHFTETGTFYRDGPAYATLHPWRAPPQAIGAAQATPSTNDAELFSSVDAVVVTVGNVDATGNAMLAGEPTSAGSNETARPTLTFVICQDEIVDRYYKISSSTPTVQGKSLRAAWDSALASGMFQAVPAH